MNHFPLLPHPHLVCAAIVLSLWACSPNPQVRRGAPAVENSATNSQDGYQNLSQEQKIPRIQAVSGEDVDESVITTEEAVMATDIAGAYLRQPDLKEMGKAIAVKVQNSAQAIGWELHELVLNHPGGDHPNLVVLYQIETAGRTTYGMIPQKSMKMTDYSITLPLRGEGMYIPVVTQSLVIEEVPYHVDHQGMSQWMLTQKLEPITPVPHDIVVQGTRVFASQGNAVTSIETSGPSWRVAESLSFGPNAPQQLAFSRNRIYASEPKAGLASFQLPSPNNNPAPGLKASVASPNTTNVHGLALSGGPVNNMYLLEEAPSNLSPTRLRISRFDIQGANPQYEATYTMTIPAPEASGRGGDGGPRGGASSPAPRLLVADMRLYILHEGGVFSLDVTNNDQFSLPAVYNQLEQPSAMAINQTRTRLYVADRNGHIHVLDVTDPRSPSLIFRLRFQANIVDMLIHAGQLFAIDGANRLLHRFDISQANTVAWKDSLALPEKPLRIRSLLNELLIPVNKKGIVRVQMSNGA